MSRDDVIVRKCHEVEYKREYGFIYVALYKKVWFKGVYYLQNTLYFNVVWGIKVENMSGM